ncbi:MAG: cyclopropane fatty-acyl-phospholipid synthase-like methyltransferase [Saprospiraceae bacterium]
MTNIAQTVDIHRLYEAAVQCVEAEIDMVDATYKSIRGYHADYLREDFCGTAQTSVEWINRRSGNLALGVDIDSQVLAWSQANHLESLSEAERARIQLLCEDVNTVELEPAQIILAMNFSYQLFDTRESLRTYFKNVRQSSSDDGVFFLDAYGGYESYKEVTEETQCEFEGHPFTYVWEQASYNPITGAMHCYIHFSFEDGSKINRAFSYAWRLWTLPELQELLLEAGFQHVKVYWEGTDTETGEGNGLYQESIKGDADASWICYLSAHNN